MRLNDGDTSDRYRRIKQLRDHEFFEELLAASVAAHGHLCAGQVVGVRMALLGLRLLNFEAPPTLPELKRLLVYVEMDRCTGDAVAHTTGVKLGRRSLKFVDYGIMAATFVDLDDFQGLPGHLHRRVPGFGGGLCSAGNR